MSKPFKVGDIFHGMASCGNVYQVISIDDESEMVMAYCVKIDTPTAYDMRTGQFLARHTLSLGKNHLAKDCRSA